MNSKRIIVPCKCIGLVIGQGGGNIKRLAQTYKCAVQFLRDEADENGNMPLYIRSETGQFENVIAVEGEVQGLVSSIKPRIY